MKPGQLLSNGPLPGNALTLLSDPPEGFFTEFSGNFVVVSLTLRRFTLPLAGGSDAGAAGEGSVEAGLGATRMVPSPETR